jgi:hypothetical protein
MTIRFSMLPHQIPWGPKSVSTPFYDHPYPLSFNHNFVYHTLSPLSCRGKKSRLGSAPAAPPCWNAIGCTSQCWQHSLIYIEADLLTKHRSILPALAFSLDMFSKTHQSYGVNEVLLASVLGSVVFSLFAAQPLVIVGVTGNRPYQSFVYHADRD